MTDKSSILGRKLQTRAARSPITDPMTAVEALARRCEDLIAPLIGLGVNATADSALVMRFAEAVDTISEHGLLGLVDIEGADAPGLVAAQSELVDHLLGLTLGGSPTEKSDSQARHLTTIDMEILQIHLASIVQALQDSLSLALGHQIESAIAIREIRSSLSGLRPMSPDIDVLTFGVSIRTEEGSQGGQILLIVPLSSLDALKGTSGSSRRPLDRKRPDGIWSDHMRRAARMARVPLEAVLHKQGMSIAEAQNLQVGDVIEIPTRATEAIQLTLAQPDGKCTMFATAQLGAYQDRKVVKLDSAPDKRVESHICQSLSSKPKDSLVATAEKLVLQNAEGLLEIETQSASSLQQGSRSPALGTAE